MNDEWFDYKQRCIDNYEDYADNYIDNLEFQRNMKQEKIEQLQSNWNSLREIIKDCNKRYEDSNIELNDTYKYYLNSPLPPRYTMNLGAIELIDYLLDKMNELEGGIKNEDKSPSYKR